MEGFRRTMRQGVSAVPGVRGNVYDERLETILCAFKCPAGKTVPEICREIAYWLSGFCVKLPHFLFKFPFVHIFLLLSNIRMQRCPNPRKGLNHSF